MGVRSTPPPSPSISTMSPGFMKMRLLKQADASQRAGRDDVAALKRRDLGKKSGPR
jgi:hypothetical protein